MSAEMVRHVAHYRYPNGTLGRIYQGACTCGAPFPQRATRAQATIDYRRHADDTGHRRIEDTL